MDEKYFDAVPSTDHDPAARKLPVDSGSFGHPSQMLSSSLISTSTSSSLGATRASDRTSVEFNSAHIACVLSALSFSLVFLGRGQKCLHFT